MHEHEFSKDQPQDEPFDLDEIMFAFGIGTWENLGSIATASTTEMLVGIEGTEYVLKERPEGPLGEDTDHRYNFQRHLTQAGIPVPEYRLTLLGKPFVTLGEASFELQRLPEGERFTTEGAQSLSQVEFSGTMLGRIHRASLYYAGHQHHWPSEAHIGAMVQSYLNLARAKANESAIYAISSALSQWVETWEAILPSAMMSIGSGGRNIPTFHIHGDYHALNLRFGSSGVTAVMGLEASRWEKRIFELAYALFYFSALKWLPGEGLTPPLVRRGFAPERVRQFLHAYGSVYSPEPGEAALLTDALLLVAPIAIVNGPLEDLFYTQDEPDSALVEDIMERLSWATSLPAWLTRVRSSLQEMWEAG